MVKSSKTNKFELEVDDVRTRVKEKGRKKEGKKECEFKKQRLNMKYEGFAQTLQPSCRIQPLLLSYFTNTCKIMRS